ncbi:hypothetical protein CUMW_128430, partial [Citrus unshiu]
KCDSNISAAKVFLTNKNSFSGNIPIELGLLQWLNMFQVSVYSLKCSIPIQLCNIYSIDYFAMTHNQLIDEIPHYVGFTLPNIHALLLGSIRFTELILPSISNATKLEKIDFTNNSIRGNNLRTGKGNDLRFLDSLVNCSSSKVVSLGMNNHSPSITA